MSFRWLRVRIGSLPPESATKTALRNAHPDQVGGGDPSEGRWSQLEVLVGIDINETRLLRYENALSRVGKGDKKPKAPELLPLPGSSEKKKKRPPLPPHVAEFLFAHMNGGASPDLIQNVKAGEGVLNGVHQRR
jgi:hypothetical protein